MSNASRTSSIIGLGALTLWDGVTTIYGTYSIVGNSLIDYAISIASGVGLSWVMVKSIPILRNPKEDVITFSTKAMWFLALLYDLYTAYMGNFNILLTSVNDTPKIIIAIGLTIFTCYAPIGLSYIVYNTDIE